MSSRNPFDDTLPDFYLEVAGVPAPQGSKSFKGMRYNKATGRSHAVMVESSKKVKPWRDAVRATAEQALPTDWVPLNGPLRLAIEFYLPRPKAAPKTLRTLPTPRPDSSKLLRSTEDALVDARVCGDDSLFVDTTIRKRYATELEALLFPWERRTPGARIGIWRIDLDFARLVEEPIVPPRETLAALPHFDDIVRDLDLNTAGVGA